jgi:predicted nucleic acid-binding protein
MKRVAVIDNNVLANFLDAGEGALLEQARVVFSQIYIPQQVLTDFLNVSEPYLHQRQRFANNIGTDVDFFRHCYSFDPIVLGLLQSEKGIHSGEAEAIAQAVRRDIPIILTDDVGCKKYVAQNKHSLRCFGTLFIAAILVFYQVQHPASKQFTASIATKRKNSVKPTTRLSISLV